MKFLKHIPALLLFIFGALFLHYFLPQQDIVKVVGVEIVRTDVDKDDPFWDQVDAGNNVETTRDVRFINTEFPNGEPMVYRNEDTGWSFPPYFKFDSSNLVAQAQSFEKQENQWVIMRHYGWRIELFSIYPNVTSIKKVDGPHVQLTPVFNIVFISLLLILWGGLWWKIRSWKAKRIDPTLDKVGETLGGAARDVGETVGQGSEKARGFWKKLFGSSKPPRT